MSSNDDTYAMNGGVIILCAHCVRDVDGAGTVTALGWLAAIGRALGFGQIIQFVC